jgi:ribosomal protein L16 Arg81 hydroxylase
MIDPVGIDEFLEEYYERKTQHVQRTDPAWFADILNADDIDRVFERTAISRSVIRVTKEGNEVHADRFCESADSPSVSNARLLDLFGSGHTLIFNSGDCLFSGLDRYCRAVAGELQLRVQPNIYITPFDARGFDNHYDDHDVFILQVMGSKTWRLYHSPEELPSVRQKWVPGTYALRAPELEVTLSPGDSLYIPRGVLHDARTSGTASAHITLGLHPIHRFDLMQELAWLAQDMPAFRRSIPLGLLRDRAAAGDEFKRLLMDLVARVDVDELIKRRHTDFTVNRRPDFRHMFSGLTRLNQLTLDTTLRKRADVPCTVDRGARTLTVRFAGRKIPIQPFLESALDLIVGDDAFVVREIDGFVSDTGRLDLARTFVRAGLLEIVELNGLG